MSVYITRYQFVLHATDLQATMQNLEVRARKGVYIMHGAICLASCMLPTFTAN